MRTNKIKSAMFAMSLMIAMLISDVAFGQLFTPYTISRTTNIVYSSIMGSGGGTYPTNWNYGLLGDDMLTGKISLGGWSFNYDNANQTAFMISTNGFITFDTTLGNTTGSGCARRPDRSYA